MRRARIFGSVLLIALAGSSSCQETTTLKSELRTVNPVADSASKEETLYSILPCNRSDPAIGKCFEKVLKYLKPYLIRGIPELDLPPLDPLRIPRLERKYDQGALMLSTIFENLFVSGLYDYKIEKFRTDISSLRLDLNLSIPMIGLQTYYALERRYLPYLSTIENTGYLTALFENISVKAKMQGIEDIKNGIRHLRIGRLDLTYPIGSQQMRLTSLFDASSGRGQFKVPNMHKEVPPILRWMEPPFVRAEVESYFMDFFNTALTKIPLDIWLRDM